MSGYRGELEAALARITQLEAEVAALRGQLEATPAIQARLSELRARRAAALASLRDVERRARTWLTTAVVVVLAGALAFVGTIASMGSSGHPLNASLLALVIGAPIIAYVAWTGSERRSSSLEAVNAVDREIATTLEPVNMARVASPAIRVSEDVEEEPPSEAPERDTRNRAPSGR